MERCNHKKISTLGVFIFLFLAGSSFAESPTSPTALNDIDYGTGVSKKLGRGVANVAFGWMEVFKGMEEVGEENNFIAGLTWGPIYGVSRAIGRTAVGVYEVVTFPVPAPANFEAIVKPEFVLEDTR